MYSRFSAVVCFSRPPLKIQSRGLAVRPCAQERRLSLRIPARDQLHGNRRQRRRLHTCRSKYGSGCGTLAAFPRGGLTSAEGSTYRRGNSVQTIGATSSLESPAVPVNSQPAICPPLGAHSSLRTTLRRNSVSSRTGQH